MINPKKEYSLKDIRDGKMIPWALHYQTLRRIISKDFTNGNILQAVRKGEDRQIRYAIRGSNIIKYKKNYCKELSKQ